MLEEVSPYQFGKSTPNESELRKLKSTQHIRTEKLTGNTNRKIIEGHLSSLLKLFVSIQESLFRGT